LILKIGNQVGSQFEEAWKFIFFKIEGRLAEENEFYDIRKYLLEFLEVRADLIVRVLIAQ